MAHGKHRLRSQSSRKSWPAMNDLFRQRITTIERIVAMICITLIILTLIGSLT